MDIKEQNSVEEVYQRLKFYLHRLESIIGEIVEELDCNRKERNEWFEWHEDWKSAWLNQTDENILSIGESENQRFITSIKRRNSLFDLKREVSDLKNDLENIRHDREKLLFFLENTNFAQKLEIKL